MRDLLGWNLSLGHWAGVPVRLHVFFLLFAICAVHFSAAQQDLLYYALWGISILFFSVLAHEMGHCYAAWKLGGSVDQVLLWPLGGLVPVNVTHDPRDEFWTAAAGPAVNLGLCVLLLPVIWLTGVGVGTVLNPLVPPLPAGQLHLINVLQLAFWTNWVLFWLNLLPAFPLDGSRLARSLLWPRVGYRTAVHFVVHAATLMALLMGVVAVLTYGTYQYASLPLALLGMFLFSGARQEAARLQDLHLEEASMGFEYSAGYSSLERRVEAAEDRPRGAVRQWLENRRASRMLRQQQIEDAEEQRVDEVLSRLHEEGLEALSQEDRALLERVSARYRNRLHG